MAEFLTTTDCSAAIERIIRNAEREVTLVSAYVIPRLMYIERLKDAASRGVRIRLIFGKRPMDDRVMAHLRTIYNLEVHYLHVLHAKCYYNEHEAVVTSLNLLGWSEQKNREMGVLLDRVNDRTAFEELKREVTSILNIATEVYASPLQNVHSLATDDATAVYRAKRPKRDSDLPPDRNGLHWGKAEELDLKRMHKEGWKLIRMATELQRTKGAVRSRLIYLSLIGPDEPWA